MASGKRTSAGMLSRHALRPTANGNSEDFGRPEEKSREIVQYGELLCFPYFSGNYNHF